MTASKHTEDLQTLAQEREKAKQQLDYWTQREKILSHQMAQLTFILTSVDAVGEVVQFCSGVLKLA